MQCIAVIVWARQEVVARAPDNMSVTAEAIETRSWTDDGGGLTAVLATSKQMDARAAPL